MCKGAVAAPDSARRIRAFVPHPETYERITAILRSLLPDPDAPLPEDADQDIWGPIALDLCSLRDPQARERIEKMLDADLFDPMDLRHEDVEELYAATDPMYGVFEPQDLLSCYRGMQEAWRRSETKAAAEAQRHAPSRPDRRSQSCKRKQKRKSQRSRRKKKKR